MIFSSGCVAIWIIWMLTSGDERISWILWWFEFGRIFRNVLFHQYVLLLNQFFWCLNLTCDTELKLFVNANMVCENLWKQVQRIINIYKIAREDHYCCQNIFVFCVEWSWNGLGNSGRSGYSGKPVARNLNYFEFDVFSFIFCRDLWKIVLFKRGYACLLHCIFIFSASLPKIKLKFWCENILIESKVKFGSASFWIHVFALSCFVVFNALNCNLCDSISCEIFLVPSGYIAFWAVLFCGNIVIWIISLSA